MKKYILILIISLILTSCGSGNLQQDFDKLLEDNEALQDNNQKLQKENQTLDDKITLLEQEKILLEEEKTKAIEELEEIIPKAIGPTVGAPLLLEVTNILNALSTMDMVTVSLYADPVDGVRFSPYQYVDIADDIVLTQAEINNYFSLAYTWGEYDGSGDPINLNTTDYFNDFVYDEDYLSVPTIGQNTVVSSGNMINNIETVYAGMSFVEFYYPGFDPIYSGMDWSSITLVMKLQAGQWYLVGIVNGQWTI